MKGQLAQAFVEIYGEATSLGVGRATIAIADTTHTANAVRRILVATTGAIVVDETNGFDYLGMTTGWTLATPVTLTLATDMKDWSHGYVAATTTPTTTASTAKNAKVVIGTILSALFAIALLN
jgi:hypothetical protein